MHPGVDPLALLATWYAEAIDAEPRVPDAMQLATVEDGLPMVRTVLLKSFGPEGWTFFTNRGSAKARQLRSTPYASACLHWKSLERQVIVHGPVEPVSDEESDAYFATRPRGSQLGAWASRQSEPLAVRETLDERLAAMTARFGDGPVPRPDFWGGLRLVPDRYEFWQGRTDRLHDRITLLREGESWKGTWLYP